jgi:hypothetical protein
MWSVRTFSDLVVRRYVAGTEPREAPMKKLIPAVLIASAALVVATTLPANAATKSISVTDGTGPAAVDTKTKLVYVGTTPSPPPNPEPGQDWNSSAGVAKVDPSKKTKVVKSVILDTLQSNAIGEFVADVKVSSAFKDLWVLVGRIDTGGACGSRLYQLKKTSLATVRTYNLGCARKIELDPTSRLAYLVEAPLYGDEGENAQPLTKASVIAVNGGNGVVTRAGVPSPTTGVTSFQEQYFPTSIAFDRKNYGIYVVGQSTVWIYTTKFKLVHTTKVDYAADATVLAAANRTTNLIYFSDGETLTEIFGPTGNVRRTSVVSGGSTMVIDTKSNVLYLGTNTVRLSTLLATGKQQPHQVQSVDPRTHARYSAESSKLYITR